jgi:hypothetical protein
MLFVAGFICAIVIDFAINMITDFICKDAGKKCNYNCKVCKSKCVGAHCYFMRQSADTNVKGGNDGEIPDTGSADTN